MKKYDIKLSFNELELIDGKVSEDAQKVIQLARKENSFGFSLTVMNEILRKWTVKLEIQRNQQLQLLWWQTSWLLYVSKKHKIS